MPNITDSMTQPMTFVKPELENPLEKPSREKAFRRRFAGIKGAGDFM